MTRDSASSLWGRISAADMGAALHEHTHAIPAPQVVGALPGDRRLAKGGDILAATERAVSAAAGVAYRPKTRATAAAWADVLAAADDFLGGAAPRDAVYAAADEALSILAAPGRSDAERRALLCALFGNDSLSHEEIARLSSAARRVTDYGDVPISNVNQENVIAPVDEDEFSSEESSTSEAEEDSGHIVNVDALARAVVARMERRSASTVLVAPEGATRTQLPGGHEEVSVPAPSALPPPGPGECVRVSELPAWTHDVLGANASLNRMQSVVLPHALGTDAPLLVSAPTGSGKTTVALLAMLRCIGLSMGLLAAGSGSAPDPSLHPGASSNVCAAKDDERSADMQSEKALPRGKIVYIAPMRALVAEAVRTFSERLSALGVRVAELTGDTATAPALLAEASVIVATPEKWDVVTRKSPSETATAAAIGRVALLVVDEVHLLDDSSRGPVLEAVVVRARLGGARVVGLSATLPNYRDVGRFLGCDASGVFHFGPAHRPCPLALSVVAVCANQPAGASRQPLQRMRAMDEVAAEAVLERLAASARRQALVFVHARRETVRFARFLRDRAEASGRLSVLVGAADGRSGSSSLSTAKGLSSHASHSAQNEELCAFGIATHHAGMDRSARLAAESAFANGSVRVLVATATLAWGVNLPAHTVVIRGTQVYDAARGAWADLSPQDALQMLGRAGRPQYDTSGSGVVVTAGGRSSLSRYVSLLTAQACVESRMLSRVRDVLLAEVCAGRVRSVADAARYLSLTFLAVRALEDPVLYGLDSFEAPSLSEPEPFPLHDANGKRSLVADEGARLQHSRQPLEAYLSSVAHSALRSLATMGLVAFTGHVDAVPSADGAPKGENPTVAVTELGRVAAHYYVPPAGVTALEARVGPYTTHADVISAFAALPELAALHVRAEERADLETLADRLPFPVDMSNEDAQGTKAALLLQAHIARATIAGHALASDCANVRQSAARVLRALMALALDRGHCAAAIAALDVCRWVHAQQWPSESPLWQLTSDADRDAVARFERVSGGAVAPFGAMDAAELGEHVRSQSAGETLRRLFASLPQVSVAAHVRLACRELVTLDVKVSLGGSGAARPLWLLVSAPALSDGSAVLVAHRRVTLMCGTERTISVPAVLPRSVVPADRGQAVFHVYALLDNFVGADSSSGVLVDGRSLGERFVKALEGIPCANVFNIGDARLWDDLYAVSRGQANEGPLQKLSETIGSAPGSVVVWGSMADAAIVLACMREQPSKALVVTCHGAQRVAMIKSAVAGLGATVIAADDLTLYSALTSAARDKAYSVIVVEDLQHGMARSRAAAELLLSFAVRQKIKVVLVQHGLPWGDGRDVGHWLRASEVHSTPSCAAPRVMHLEDALMLPEIGLVVADCALDTGCMRCVSSADVYGCTLENRPNVVLVVSAGTDPSVASSAAAFVASHGCCLIIAPETHGDLKLAELLSSAGGSALPVESALSDVFSDAVLALVACGTHTTPASVADVLNDTLLARRIQRNPRLYGAASSADASARLSALIDDALRDLCDAGMVECTDGDTHYAATPHGILAAHRGLTVQTTEMAFLTLAAALARGTHVGVRGVIEMAAASREVEDVLLLHVRMCNDETSLFESVSALALRCPYRVPRGHPLTSRPLASVLLQSLLLRAALDDAAHRVRTAVHRAAARVIRSLVDVCGASLGPARHCVHALQHMHTGTREGDSALLQLVAREPSGGAAGDRTDVLRRAIADGGYGGLTVYDVDADVLRTLFPSKDERKTAARLANAFPALSVDAVECKLRDGGAAWDICASVSVSAATADASRGPEPVWLLAVSSSGELLSTGRVLLEAGGPASSHVLLAPSRPSRLLVLCEERIGADIEHEL